ncbi:hypothetical protein IAR50_003548 [Cryptococcus sp. DSM 104548]
MDTVDPTFSPNMNNCKRYILPELVVIHCDLDWKLDGVWGTKNRKTQKREGDSIGLWRVLGPLIWAVQRMRMSKRQRWLLKIGPAGWEDIETEPYQGFTPNSHSLENSHHSHTPPSAVAPVASDVLYLGVFDPENFDNDEDAWSDADNVAVAYEDDGFGLPEEVATTALREGRHSEGRYTEDGIVYMLKDFVKVPPRASTSGTRKGEKPVRQRRALRSLACELS